MNFNIFGVFIKCIFLGGMNILWLSFWDYNKIGLDLEVISMHFNVKVQNWLIFSGDAKISNIIFGCLIFLIFFLGGGEW